MVDEDKEIVQGYCPTEGKFVNIQNKDYPHCPDCEKIALHQHYCISCKEIMGYWYNDDDYIISLNIICKKCADAGKIASD